MLLHKNFNSTENRVLGVYKKTPKSLLSVFCLPVDPLSFRHNFDSCDATPNATLTGPMSLCQLKNGVVRQNST